MKVYILDIIFPVYLFSVF